MSSNASRMFGARTGSEIAEAGRSATFLYFFAGSLASALIVAEVLFHYHLD